MRSPEPRLSLLLLTEDAGKDAHATLEVLCKKMLQLVEPQCGTHLVQFLPADDEARKATAGKRHTARTPAGFERRRLLAGKIARQLLRDDRPGFVAYHADADRIWSARREDDFPDYRELRRLVSHVLENPERRAALHPDATARIDRFFLLGAYWEIEAWLYQNTEVAIRLCQEHDGGRHVDLLERWTRERARIDEVTNIKEEGLCLGSRHNRTLASQAYPAQEAYAAGTSFAAAVTSLQRCPALLTALQQTHS